MIPELLSRFRDYGSAVVIADRDQTRDYADLLRETERWRDRLTAAGIPSGSVVSLEGEYGLTSVAALLALVDAGHILVPLTADSARHHDLFRDIASVEWRVRLTTDDAAIEPTGRQSGHALYADLRDRQHPGLVLFSSGSTGQPKAAVHDLTRLLAKYAVRRQGYRTLVFLLLDHIGGINTLFFTLSNGGAIVTSPRTPNDVCAAIERHRVELLPTSPTFLNLLLLSGAHRQYDLSSLTLITYGTEPMPASTLRRLRDELPDVRVQQTYGLTELGILRSRSRDSDSLWVKVGGEDFETKVVEGTLRIKARSAMLGYLNAPSPIDADGFFDTGDLVETDGDWVRFLGRTSEVINVGGSKVFPAEVESVLLQMDNVADAVVSGEPHPLVGQVVAAVVRVASEEPLDAFKLRMRQFLRDRIPAFKHPARVRLTSEPLHSARFKRARGSVAVETA